MKVFSDTVFRRFCARSQVGRFQINLPGIIGSWEYATNGHICVRRPCLALPVNNAETFPGADAVFDLLPQQQKISDTWMKLPSCDPQTQTSWCPHCEGMNTAPLVAGDYEFEEDEEDNCVACRGTGRVIVASYFLFADRCFAAHYCRMVQLLLPNPVYLKSGTHKDPLFFRFDGGEGALMPRNFPDPHSGPFKNSMEPETPAEDHA